MTAVCVSLGQRLRDSDRFAPDFVRDGRAKADRGRGAACAGFVLVVVPRGSALRRRAPGSHVLSSPATAGTRVTSVHIRHPEVAG